MPFLHTSRTRGLNYYVSYWDWWSQLIAVSLGPKNLALYIWGAGFMWPSPTPTKNNSYTTGDLQFLVIDLHGILYRQHAMLCFTTVFNLLCACEQLALKMYGTYVGCSSWFLPIISAEIVKRQMCVVYIYPIVKLFLSFAKIVNLIQYLLGGTVFLL